MKILVVDDTEAVLLLMTRFVEALGHTAVVARNGLEAVEAWRSQKPDLILLDMMMPVMSGAEAAAIIKQEAGGNWVPIVFVTGVGEENKLAEAIERAADDYLNKPVNFRVLEAKLKAFNRTLELNRKVREQSARLADYYDRTEEEKRVVRHLMEQMVNAERLSDPQLEYWLTPAESLSGDLIAAARTPGKILHIMLADGIGHGIAAALNVLPLTQPFYSMTEKGYGLSDILVEMNNKVRQVLPVGRFVAVALIAIDETERCIEVWNGGMPTLHLLNADGDVWDTCQSFSLPLGVVPSHTMELMPVRHYFDRPGMVLAYSDGLVEARNRSGEAFGMPRLLDVVRKNTPGTCIDAARTALSDFLEGEAHHDDVSLVLASYGTEITRKQDGALLDGRGPISMAEVEACDDIAWHYTLMLGADELKYINTVPFMMTFVNNIHVLNGCQSDVFLILTELFVNALDHGVLRLDSAIKAGADGMEQYLLERMHRLAALQSGRIEIDLVGVICKGQIVLRIRIKDSGDGFDWHRLQAKKAPLAAHGRGISLVRSLCIGLQYQGIGNEVIAYYVPRNS